MRKSIPKKDKDKVLKKLIESLCISEKIQKIQLIQKR